MSIRKRTWDGGEAFVVDVRVRGERHRCQFPTRAEAREYELEVKTRARAGTWRAAGVKMTLAQLVPDYAKFLKAKVALGAMAKTTMNHRLAQIEHWVIAGTAFNVKGAPRQFSGGIGLVRLADLNQEAVEDWLRDVASFGHTAGTLWEIKGALSGLLEYAKKKKFIAGNPARTLSRKDFPARPALQVEPPSHALIQRMIVAADPWLAVRIKFAALTGLRIGEQLGLRWREVDFEKGLVRVTRSVGDYGEGSTKTDAGQRKVPISESLLAELRLIKGSAGSDDLVFPSVRGLQCRAGTITNAFHRTFAKVMKTWPAELAKPVRPRWHSLRHFAVSCWIEARFSPKAIQTYVGHQKFEMTMTIYGHLLFPPERDNGAMDAIAKTICADQRDAAPGSDDEHDRKAVQ